MDGGQSFTETWLEKLPKDTQTEWQEHRQMDRCFYQQHAVPTWFSQILNCEPCTGHIPGVPTHLYRYLHPFT